MWRNRTRCKRPPCLPPKQADVSKMQEVRLSGSSAVYEFASVLPNILRATGSATHVQAVCSETLESSSHG